MLPPTDECKCNDCKILSPAPPHIPGKSCLPVWSLHVEQSNKNKSFEELVLDKMKGLRPN